MNTRSHTIGEGFAFFRWHSIEWHWFVANCRYSTHQDCCAACWDRLQAHVSDEQENARG